MNRKKPARGLDPRVESGFPKRSCSTKMRSRLNFAGTALIADWLLQTLSISLPAFRIAGGLLLFSIALFQIRNTVRPGTP